MKTPPQIPMIQEHTKRTERFGPGHASVCFVVQPIMLFLLFLAVNTSAATRYVWQGSPSPAPAYDSWANAAHVIQDAIDAADPGDTVLVAGGVYATGGRAVGTNQLVNRVAIDRAITVESLMGPEVTIIQGHQVPDELGGFRGNGDGAIRCVYLTNGASLSGFTLTNGATRSSGDSIYERSGGGLLCESTNALVTNCTLTGNSAGSAGGGAYRGTLNNCTLSSNSASSGGGASGGTLNHCTLTGNSARFGGGAYQSTLNNCTLTGNSAIGAARGGGAFQSQLNNCALLGNSAQGLGGGAVASTLNNCTLTGNRAAGGGGAYDSTLFNCIVYQNQNQNGYPYSQNYHSCALSYSCTTPLPPGPGNIAADPMLLGSYHLSANSPCRGAGSEDYVTGTDIDGESWASPPSIGCDEFYAATGPLSVEILARFTNVAVGYPVEFTGVFEGWSASVAWDFGDGLMASDVMQTSHAWTAAGDYEVVFSAYNQSYPAGLSATVTVQVVTQPVHYVAPDSANPVSPYTSWATAATNIQDAVDAAGTLPGTLVLVTNGNYASGARTVSAVGETNRLAVEKPLAIRSVNGPEVTTINGSRRVRCVVLSSGASLSGFTVTYGISYPNNGYNSGFGAGVYCGSLASVVSNCVIIGNSAFSGGGGAWSGTLKNCVLSGNSAGIGGGAYRSVLMNCVLSGNRADGYEGGGADRCTLYNCTLTGNSANNGGGTFACTLNNCTVAGNAGDGGYSACVYNNCIVKDYDNWLGSSVNFSCTISPFPTGVGNIDFDPLFVDAAGGNLRLQSNSPCINAGHNAFASGSTDLDGNPRIIGGTVDMGAYEQQSPALLPYYTWLQSYGLRTDGSADTLDADLDGHNAWQEWKAWTNPTNALSVLKLLPPQPQTNGMLVLWQSVLGQSYSVERATNASGPFSLLQGNIPGLSGTTSVTDTNPANGNPILDRVAVPE